MRLTYRKCLLCALLPAGLSAVSNDPSKQIPHQKLLDRLPLAFEPNQGQLPEPARFLVRSAGFHLALFDDRAVLWAPGGSVEMRWEGARPGAKWTGGEKLPGITNYLVGNDAKKWRTHIPRYSSVRCAEIYAGIEMAVRGDRRRIEYEFHVRPGADPGQILLRFTGHEELRLDAFGDLILKAGAGQFRHSAPLAFQIREGKRFAVAAQFRIAGSRAVGFQLGPHDPNLPLIIDPVISLHGFPSGFSADTVTAIVADSAGALYFAGWTTSANFILAGTPFRDRPMGGRDAFLAKLHPSGAHLEYSTLLGGQQDDEIRAVAVDATGFAYVTGTTASPDFSRSPSGFQENYGGNGDAFVLKVNLDGAGLASGTFLGGSGADHGTSLAVDALGNLTVTGYTSSADFPMVNARQPAFGGVEDIFIFKLSSNGVIVLYSTYFGGENADQAYGVTIDESGNAYITGRTTCEGLPVGATLGSGGGTDVLVMKWRANGDGALFVTCVGGSGIDTGSAIAVDRQGNAYVTGATGSTNFPAFAAFQPGYGGAQNGPIGDGFVFKLNAAGSALLYSSYLGGVRDDWGQSIAVDSVGTAYVAGITFSSNFPSPPVAPPPNAGNRSGFVTRIAHNGAAVLESFFFEGIGAEDKYSIALDPRGELYAGGGALALFRMPQTSGQAFPPSLGGQEGFIAKFSAAGIQAIQEPYPPTVTPGSNFVYIQRAVNRGPHDATNLTVRGTVPPGMTIVSCSATGVTCVVAGASYRVDLAELKAGRGVELNVTARVASEIASGIALPLSFTAQSETHDPDPNDNGFTTTFFASSAGGACTYNLSSQAATLDGAGGQVSIFVSAPFSCPWTAAAFSEWLTFISPSAAAGPATITLSFPPNPLPNPRTASLIIAGQRVALIQRPAPSSAPFEDVSASHPFAEFIQLIRYSGITAGCSATQFCPDAPTTRAQMAAFIVRAIFGGDTFPFPAAPFFDDVQPGHPQFRHIQKLRELGITNGCAATRYCPGDPVTRSQMAAFLIRARLAIPPTQGFPFLDASGFADVPPSNPFYGSVQKMKELGITTGCSPFLYCPDEPTTRGQMAVFLTRTFLTP